MNKTNLPFNTLKYTIFTIISLILILVWQCVFILQSGIGLVGNVLLTPVKLLPIFLYSTLAFWLTLKMFDFHQKVSRKKYFSLVIGGVAVMLSAIFQYSSPSKRIPPFIFKNKMFSLLEPVSIRNNFKNRMILSSAEYLRLMPFAGMDKDFIAYIAHVAAEATFIYELQKLIDDGELKKTCKKYIETHADFHNCIIDFQKEVYSHYKITSTGNVLMVAIGSLGVFKVQGRMKKQYGKKNLYVFVKSFNDLIETFMLSVENSKSILLSKDRSFGFGVGRKSQTSAILATIESQINYKFLIMAVENVGGLIANVEKKAPSIQNKDRKREVSSTRHANFEREKSRFTKLKAQYQAFQEDGFKIDELKQKLKGIHQEMEEILHQVKEESFIFSVAAFFDSSLDDLTIEDLFKAKNSK